MVTPALKRYIDDRTPFGPIKSEDLAKDKDLSLFRELYSSGTEIHTELADRAPNCLLGRKGSGKTAFLLGLLVEEGSDVVQLRQSSLFAGMENVVRAYFQADASVNADIVAEVWDAVLLHVMAIRIADTISRDDPNDASSTVWRYVSTVEAEATIARDVHPDERCDEIANWLLSALQSHISASKSRNAGPTFLHRLEVDGISLLDLQRACRDIAASRERRIVIMVDSLEDFGDNFTKLAEVSRGLLQHLSNHGEDRSGYGLFVCLPAEVSALLREISANPAKAFEHSLFIRWGSRDLVRLAAQRFAMFLQLHDPDGYRATGSPSTSRVEFDEARALLDSLLPETIVNRLGTTEPSLTYLIRHTQLLPRQFIQYLNSVWRKNRALGGTHLRVLPQALLDGIEEAEGPLIHDVLSAYKAQHPLANEVCEVVIPKLRLVNSTKDLRKAISKSKASTIVPDGVSGAMRLLLDIGAIGRQRNETRLYVEADFSFTFTKTLPLLEDDDVACLHGSFAQYFECTEVRRHETGTALPVYPYGVDFASAAH